MWRAWNNQQALIHSPIHSFNTGGVETACEGRVAERGAREQPTAEGESDLALWVEQGFPRMGLGRGAEGVGPKNQILNKMETYDPGTRFF